MFCAFFPVSTSYSESSDFESKLPPDSDEGPPAYRYEVDGGGGKTKKPSDDAYSQVSLLTFTNHCHDQNTLSSTLEGNLLGSTEKFCSVSLR